MGRSITIGSNEHQSLLHLGNGEQSAMANHVQSTGHDILFDQTVKLFQSASL